MPHKRARADALARDTEHFARRGSPLVTGDHTPEAVLWHLEALRAVLPSMPLVWLRQALRRLRIIVSEIEVLVEMAVSNGLPVGPV